MQRPDLLAICLEGSTERSDGNRGRSPRIASGENDVPGRHYARGYVNKSLSYSVVPSRHVVSVSSHRALRTRLPSLRSVVPSRHFAPHGTMVEAESRGVLNNVGCARQLEQALLHSLARKLRSPCTIFCKTPFLACYLIRKA